MSFADDEGHSDGVDFEPIEDLWEEEIHRTNNCEYVTFSEMDTQHIINTINYFKKTHDVTKLQNELNRRKNEL